MDPRIGNFSRIAQSNHRQLKYTQLSLPPDLRDYKERNVFNKIGSNYEDRKRNISPSPTPIRSIRASDNSFIGRNFDQGSNFTEHSALLISRKEGALCLLGDCSNDLSITSWVDFETSDLFLSTILMY